MRRGLAIFLCLLFLIFPVRGETPARYVALTFDDGPSGRFTRSLLAGLEERGVKATFLLCGYRLREYPQTGQAIFDAGHEIGLHGFTHKSMANMSCARIEKELQDTLALLPEGCEPAFLRPPGGETTRAVRQAAKNQGLAVLNWSVDPRDWATHNAAAVEQAVTGACGDGDIILLHDMCDSSVAAALAIVDALKAQGFQFVTVSELARLRGMTPQPGQVYSRFR